MRDKLHSKRHKIDNNKNDAKEVNSKLYFNCKNAIYLKPHILLMSSHYEKCVFNAIFCASEQLMSYSVAFVTFAFYLLLIYEFENSQKNK
jgi:hypothetical protein